MKKTLCCSMSTLDTFASAFKSVGEKLSLSRFDSHLYMYFSPNWKLHVDKRDLSPSLKIRHKLTFNCS